MGGKQRVATLIPWRGGDERREWCWDVTRPRLEALGWPVYTGEPPFPEWARAHAVNAAARAAGDWEIALVGDCDTFPSPDAVRRAVAWVTDTRGAARPHDERWMLTKEGSLVMAQRGPAALEPHHFGRLFPGGGLLVIHRDAYDAVGGYDEEFVGWGYEDSAMNLALLRRGLWHRLPGDAWHLWHPTAANTARPESRARYKALLKENEEVIRLWARNKGLRAPSELF